MYAHFYQLSEDPFNLTPDPKFHYINESTREAMASILHGIKGRKGFITLIGEAGTGKTTLLKRILDEIEGETQIVFVFNPGVSFDELLEFICMELGVVADGGRRLQLLDKLNTHLLEQLTRGRNVVVMIDEAQTLDDHVLEELRLLSNLETSKEKILQILLSGQPELEEKLRKPGLRQLRQRIAARATLKPMRAGEIGLYIETRLRSAGADRMDFFSASSLRKVWRASRGIPRVINVICDNAMMIAFAEGKRRITNRVMAEAIRDLHDPDTGLVETLRGWFSAPSVRYATAAVAGLVLAVPIALNVASSGVPAAVRSLLYAPSSPRAASPTPTPGSAGVGDAEVAARGIPAANAADHAVATSPSASDVKSEFELSDTIRDSMRRAALVARTTAARLYQPSAAAPPPPEPAVAPGARSTVTVPPRRAEERIVDFGLRADTKDESPRPNNKLDDSALVSLQAPLRSDETAAFAEAPDASVENPDGKAGGRSHQPQPAPAPAADGDADGPALRALKPVKAGTVAVDATDPERKTATADERSTQPPSAKRPTKDVPAPEPVPGVAPDRGRAGATGVAPRTEALAVTASPESASDAEGTGQDNIASASPGTLATLGPRANEPLIGQLVRVLPGDTLWDIAVAYYGTAGPATLKHILNANPGIDDPRHLDAGSHIYLPWQRPEQMVNEDAGGTYSVLLAVAPLESRLAPARRWVEALISDAKFSTSMVNGTERSYQLRLVGIASRDEALQVASDLLDQQASRQAPGAGGNA